jgi:glycosyltransferase involved in cell wall biosynthesis
MPTWNGEPFVAEALHSALAQGYGDFELLVLDDASTDGTLDVVSQSRDARIEVHRNRKRVGLAANWNRCFKLARGEYVMLFFQDDLLAPDALERLMAPLEAEPDACLSFGRRSFVSSGSGTMKAPGPAYSDILEAFYARPGKMVRGIDLVREALAGERDLTTNVVGEPSFVLMRREAALRTLPFDTRLRQLCDWDFWLRMSRAAPMCRVDAYVGTFRLHAGSATSINHGQGPLHGEHFRFYGNVSAAYGPLLSDGDRQRLRRLRLVSSVMAFSAAIGVDRWRASAECPDGQGV